MTTRYRRREMQANLTPRLRSIAKWVLYAHAVICWGASLLLLVLIK